MKSVLAISLLLSAPLLFTQRAAAQDCFCGVAPTFGLDAAAEPALAETPDTTIESVLLVVEQVPAPAAPAAPGVLWCTSGSDPRCMPMQPSDAPSFRALSSGPVAITIDLPDTRAHRIARELDSVTPAEGLAPARGVTTSIDRPPRG